MITHVLIESLHHAGKNGDMRAITHGAMDQQVNGRTGGRTDGRTDKGSYRVACPRLKTYSILQIFTTEMETEASPCLDLFSRMRISPSRILPEEF